jgi:hypothetical protein
MLNQTTANQSRFSHDCDCCVFVSQVVAPSGNVTEDVDVWVCPRHNELIVRFSSRPDHYMARGLSDFLQMPGRPVWNAALALLKVKQAQLAGIRL